jgi:hypothetical protein
MSLFKCLQRRQTFVNAALASVVERATPKRCITSAEDNASVEQVCFGNYSIL